MGWPLSFLAYNFCLQRSVSRPLGASARRVLPTLDNLCGRKKMLRLRKLWLAFLVAIIVLALAPAPGWGQNVYGTIAGAVTDTSGAAVANATVTLTNLDTAQKRSIETDSSGNYTFVNILPGRYKLEGEKTGFKKFVREPIVVQIESGLRVDISLPVGAQTETVEVTSEVPLLQPETASLGQVVEQRTVTELPLNGRNPLALVGLVPGVVPQGNPSAGNSSGGNPVGANPFALGERISSDGIAPRGIARRRVALWHNARHQTDQRQRIAAVQWQLSDRPLFDHLPQRGRFGLEQRHLGSHLDSLGLRPNWQRDIHSQPAFDLHHDGLTHKLLKAGLFALQLVAAGQNIHERVVAGRVGFYAALLSGI